ncbi:EamA family transporter RarD [Bacillus sp. EAC]|uniref:EamA family transporter RarD n=1 Tax=Bacillus sp. EAC TaxID=1978338 RepID=UPI000B43EEA1|nr:EamA family transporter RarD [Bacillus sp. EAC]
MNSTIKGILYGVFAYVVWGVLPIYWKLIQDISPFEILTHRIIWSFVTLIVFIILTRKFNELKTALNKVFSQKKVLLAMVAVSLLISSNWLLYIWAVNSNHILDASLGYYINPLVSIILGVIVLKEKLSLWQIFSVCLATIGVGYLTIMSGTLPIVAILLSLTFAFYGLLKKILNIDAFLSLTIETLLIFPVALIYFSFLASNGDAGLLKSGTIEQLLIVGAGLVTILPLLFFGKATQLIPYTYVGFLQFISPTISLVIGVLLYGENFTHKDLISFSFIWVACLIFAISSTPFMKTIEQKIINRNKKQTMSA